MAEIDVNELNAAVVSAVQAGQRAQKYDAGLEHILQWEYNRVLAKTVNRPGEVVMPRIQYVKGAFDKAWMRAFNYHNEKIVMTRVCRSEGGQALLTMVAADVKMGDFRKALVTLSNDLMEM